ncbi:MAG: oligosaccharide flippase family protein [Candidatus Pacebacteria bacterium]|nr:oligosaccharide flippase family protein [Candidatus Paceibacterota bacterium]
MMLQIGSLGAMLAQAIGGVILARILGPQEYGRFAIVMSMAAVGSVFLGAGAADALAPMLTRAYHREDDGEVRRVFLFLGGFVISAALFSSALGLTMPLIARHLYGDRMIGWLGFLVLMASSISTLILVPTQLGLQVAGKIKQLALLTLTDQFVRQTLVLVLAALGLGIAGAGVGHTVGAIVVLFIAYWFWSRLRRQWGALPTVPQMMAHISHTRDSSLIAPTLWVLADRNIAMLYGAAPISIAALSLVASDVSYFKIALGWVTLALSVISPISSLLNTELARIQVQRPQLLRRRFLQITGGAIAVTCAVTFGAALMARPMFSLLYGPQYALAVPLVYNLIPFGALFGLGVALGPMWRIMNRVRHSIVINIVVLVVGVPLALFSMQHWGVIGAIGMVTGWYAASHAISFWYLLKLLGKMQTP